MDYNRTVIYFNIKLKRPVNKGGSRIFLKNDT